MLDEVILGPEVCKLNSLKDSPANSEIHKEHYKDLLGKKKKEGSCEPLVTYGRSITRVTIFRAPLDHLFVKYST